MSENVRVNADRDNTEETRVVQSLQRNGESCGRSYFVVPFAFRKHACDDDFACAKIESKAGSDKSRIRFEQRRSFRAIHNRLLGWS